MFLAGFITAKKGKKPPKSTIKQINKTQHSYTKEHDLPVKMNEAPAICHATDQPWAQQAAGKQQAGGPQAAGLHYSGFLEERGQATDAASGCSALG